MIRRLALGALALVLLGPVALVGWSLLDRTAAYAAICEAGLPNLSRPPEVDAEQLGCAILAPKAIYRGLYLTGFEASSFSSPDFPQVPGQAWGDKAQAWLNCPEAGCGAALDAQLDRNYLAACSPLIGSEEGYASLEAEGWVTVSPGQFGHLGLYRREFYVSRILSVGPPPKRVINEDISNCRDAKLCDDQREPRG